MISRMIGAGLVAFSLSSTLLFSAGRTRTISANIQQSQSAHSSKTTRIFIEEDFSTAQALRSDLSDWAGRIGMNIIFAEKNEPYDLRILLASDEGSGFDSCFSPCSCSGDISCSPSSSSCNVTITLHFVSALALTPDGKLQFTETGVGSDKRTATIPLARKLAKRLSVLPDTKATPSK